MQFIVQPIPDKGIGNKIFLKRKEGLKKFLPLKSKELKRIYFYVLGYVLHPVRLCQTKWVENLELFFDLQIKINPTQKIRIIQISIYQLSHILFSGHVSALVHILVSGSSVAGKQTWGSGRDTQWPTQDFLESLINVSLI